MTTALVLGGTGFIGLELIRSLSADSRYQITAVDDLSRGRLDHDAEELFDRAQIEFVEADLTDPSALSRLNRSFDEIYLLAGVVGVRYTIEKPSDVLRTNGIIVINVVDWWRRNGGRLLYASTSEVYAGGLDTIDSFPTPTPETVPVVISDILRPRFSYAASKIFGESLVNSAARQYGLPATIVRFHNVYGPRMGYEHVVPELSLRLLRREQPFTLYGRDQRRAFCFVTDAVSGMVGALSQASSEPEIFHIGNDAQETKIGDLFHMLCTLADWRPEAMNERLAPQGSPARRCPDLTKAQNQLDYSPRIGLEVGLQNTFTWYASRHPDGQLDR